MEQTLATVGTPLTPAAEARIDAYAVPAAHAPLVPHQYVPRPLGPMDVELDITHCGICHSDLHFANGESGLETYPLVPGHEIVGTVVRAGSALSAVREGQRVGVGIQVGACFACPACLGGEENLCAQPVFLGVMTEGGFATRIRVDSRFAHPIPDALPSAVAAPLMCAGVTVYAPLVRHATAASRVGVIGVGGLGHLALQYARALGCHVTAFSSSADKADAAREFGAHEVVVTSEEGALASRMGTFDLVVSTVSADLPWADYLLALKAGGTLCVLGIPPSAIAIPQLPLILGQRRVVGSIVGSRAEMRAMLEFSARHGIAPRLEHAAMHEVNEALARLSRNEVRYRVVLENRRTA